MRHLRPRTVAATLILSSLTLGACGTGSDAGAPDTSGSPTPAAAAAGATPGEEREVDSLNPRVIISHTGGILTLDAVTGETVDDVDEPGFHRLNPAGTGARLLVSGTEGFRVFDAGIREQAHGDHSHYFESAPGFNGVSIPAPQAGHVISNAGRTTLFSDGEGTSYTFEATGSDVLSRQAPEMSVHATGAAHHGVAAPLVDGTLLTTVGTEDHRDTIRQVRGDEILAETTDCPGVHGSAVAGGAVVFGCENGPVVFRDGEFTKVSVDSDYQRSGNLAESPDSPIVLGDHKTDPDAEQERPTQVALIDSTTADMRLVDLDSSYWFRSLARGPEGQALVLTYDGDLVVIDEENGEIIHEVPAIEAWEEKEKWQEAGPILQTAGDLAYVTDAENRELVTIDIASGEVTARHPLPVPPVEMAVVTG